MCIRDRIGVEHNPAVAGDQKTVEAARCAVVDQAGQRRRINALRFRRRGLPLPGRPDGLSAVLGMGNAADRGYQDRAERGPCDGDYLVRHEGLAEAAANIEKSARYCRFSLAVVGTRLADFSSGLADS